MNIKAENRKDGRYTALLIVPTGEIILRVKSLIHG
jgi:hypothetical protein